MFKVTFSKFSYKDEAEVWIPKYGIGLEVSYEAAEEYRHGKPEPTTYQALYRRLHDLAYPSLQSKLRHLMVVWSKPDHRYHAYITRYNLSDLIAELRYINPHDIRIDSGEETSRLRRVINRYQNLVETWTWERWDWWPLFQCSRPLEEEETRVRWDCTCGEERWAIVPLPFAQRLASIIHDLASSNPGTPMQTLQPPPASFQRDTSGSSASGSTSTYGHSYQGNSQSANSSLTTALRSRLLPQHGNFGRNATDHRVIFVVKQGTDYKVAQIGATGISCHLFFSTLKEKYFLLRGFLRGWFSVWRYSHCDFYMCEKFEDHEFAPKMKNVFPEATNADYEYRPRPMDSIPPVSEHEFRKRFYACPKPQPLRHWYHRCKALGTHSYDILEFFPKKKTELEEGGDKRENFWGIYAREIISLRWVLFYNFLCVLPMLAFFTVWILPAGYSTDLQNASVPFTMMLGMLSLFWSVFLSSLQFGGPR
ncbi:hypothetical protein F4677DRAFT_447730 [Hypoxylon crocopeplum]|nr:hypothetical protein F4677DRAFT_447730 [Hypoxylon crocopeplum]